MLNKTKDLGCVIKGKWNVNMAIFECPYCSKHFEANVSDIKRNRVRHCGCSNWNEPLPSDVNGIKILSDLGTISNRRTAIFQCPKCTTGTFKAVVSDVKRGKKIHCGCVVKSKPKAIKIKPIYSSLWDNPKLKGITLDDFNILKFAYGSMKARCYRTTHHKYKDYGGRGIKVCDRWRHSLYYFALDMGKRPDGYSLDRINNNGIYEPSNCRWTTNKVQQNNKRNNVISKALRM